MLAESPEAEASSKAPGDVNRMAVLDSDQIDQLLASAGRTTRGLGVRNRALVAVLSLCGLRLSEALSLATSDVRLGEANLVVHGDGTPRTLNVPPACFDALEAWLDERRSLPGDGGSRLFVTRSGTNLSATYVRQLLPRLARDAGLPPALNPEALRRSHAHDLVRRGWPLREIQRRLGYTTAAATRRFLRSAGLLAPDDPSRQTLRGDALLHGPAPCRTCLYGDALEEEDARDATRDAFDAVLTLDTDGMIRSANPAAELLFGAEPDGLVGEIVWERFAGPQYAWLTAVCREGLASRHPAWQVQESAAGTTSLLIRAVPTTHGLSLWIRDELALGGMTMLARQFSALAHGGTAGTVAILRALRDGDGQAADFVVAAVESSETEHVLIDPEDAPRQRISRFLPADLLPGFVERLRRALETQEGSRFVVKAADRALAERTLAVRVVPLVGDWLAVATRELTP